MKLTAEQQAAVDAREKQVLVSAAAGSGKTSVLVERIYSMITGEEATDIDRLLVVTFTRAAAAEMKERIRKRIEEAIALDPGNARLRRQEALLHHAQITTIDAFCQMLVRENITTLAVDPAFRIADEGEIRLLTQEAVSESVDALYEEGEKGFLEAASCFSLQASDAALEAHILALSAQADSMPAPDDWLARCTVQETDFEGSAAVRFCRTETLRLLEGAVLRLRALLLVCEEPDGPYPYAGAIEDDIRRIGEAVKAAETGSFDEMRAALLRIDFCPIGRVGKKDAVSPEKKALVQHARDEIKKIPEALRKRYFLRAAKEAAALEAESLRILSQLIPAVQRYRACLREKKREKNLLDFNDLAHLALSVLATAVPGEDGVTFVPTLTAASYGAWYREIMIDEYQDANLLQEEIFRAIADSRDATCSRFYVGDVKQSIYRFRLARPELFMKKMADFSASAGADARKVLLHRNFRSRPAVLDAVNSIFSRLMCADLGDISYDADAFLKPGDADGKARDAAEESSAALPATEVMIGVSGDDFETFDARAIAARIRRLVAEEGYSYRDIVILLRAPGGRDEIYRRALEAAQIPVYAESRTGYFSAREVTVVLNLLRILNNPLQDIPLAGVMLSPVGDFTEEECATLKVYADEADAGGYFYEALCALAKETSPLYAGGAEEALREKLLSFLARIDDFRARSVVLPVRLLLREILDETGYLDIVSAMPDGTRRRANLQALIAKAAAFEQSSLRGLSKFVAFIEALQKYEADEGEANVLDENADVVRLMSIHKSKGLEFPVVFVANCEKGFYLADAQKELLTDADYGAALPLVEPVRRTKCNTLKRSALSRKIRLDTLGEELRILYVAMTRAKEKLILSGVVKDAAKELDAVFSDGTAVSGPLSYAARQGAGSFLRWILSAWKGHPGLHALVNGAEGGAVTVPQEMDSPPPVSFALVGEADLLAEKAVHAIDAQNRHAALMTPGAEDEAIRAGLEEAFAWRYPHENLRGLYAKTTVTELKAALLNEGGDFGEEVPDVAYRLIPAEAEAEEEPAFMTDGAPLEKAQSGAERGTLYHRVMELVWSAADGEGGFRVPETEEAVRETLAAFEREGRIEKGAQGVVRTADILAFMRTPLAGRMRKAAGSGALYTERQFMMGVAANEVDEALPAEELLLIQGIIDCYFEEEDGLVVLDYKTDRVTEADTLVSRYAVQLAYYAQALARITGKRVKEKLIYSFALREVVAV